MKWITHQTGAVFGALALSLPLPGILAAWLGAITPDLIDQRISAVGCTRKKRQKIFNKLHRGASHWFGWWLGLFLLACALPWPVLARDILIGLFAGILSHIMLDLLTPRGVPLLPFTQKFRVALPICSTGALTEYLFLTAMLIIGAFLYGGGLLASIKGVAQYF